MNLRQKLGGLLNMCVDDNIEIEGGFVSYGVNYANMADYLIAHGVTVQKWIPVTERLPEPRENPVLVTYDGGVWMAWKHSTHWELPGTLKTNRVTHWRPLPEPPKGE